MTPVMQTRFAPGQGNCLNACVASILGLPLGNGGVPEAYEELRPWLAQRDLGIAWVDAPPSEITLPGCGAYYLAAGTSPRDPQRRHAVVMSEGREVHDPHPDGRFLVGFADEFGFIVRLGLAPGAAL